MDFRQANYWLLFYCCVQTIKANNRTCVRCRCCSKHMSWESVFCTRIWRDAITSIYICMCDTNLIFKTLWFHLICLILKFCFIVFDGALLFAWHNSYEWNWINQSAIIVRILCKAIVCIYVVIKNQSLLFWWYISGCFYWQCAAVWPICMDSVNLILIPT